MIWKILLSLYILLGPLAVGRWYGHPNNADYWVGCWLDGFLTLTIPSGIVAGLIALWQS